MAYLRSPVRRLQVIDATIGLMSAQGVQAVTTRAIAAAAGVNQSSINYLFGSRDELVRAVTETLTNRVCLALESIPLEGQTVESILDQFIESITNEVVKNPEQHLLLELALNAVRNGQQLDLARWQYQRYEETCSRIIDRVCALSKTTFTGDRVVTIRFALAVLDGFEVQQLVDDDPKMAQLGLQQLGAVLAPMFQTCAT